MLFWFIPLSAVPILNSASLTTQLISLAQLRKSLRWRGGVPLIVGGLLGMPLGVLLLQRADPDAFRFGFGIFLVCWSGYLLMRPELQLKSRGPLADAAVGLTGGVTGGAIAFPGAFPAIWCALTRGSRRSSGHDPNLHSRHANLHPRLFISQRAGQPRLHGGLSNNAASNHDRDVCRRASVYKDQRGFVPAPGSSIASDRRSDALHSCDHQFRSSTSGLLDHGDCSRWVARAYYLARHARQRGLCAHIPTIYSSRRPPLASKSGLRRIERH
jgi:hypothetical protein